MTKVKEAVGSGDDFFKVVMLSKKGKRMLEQIIGQVLGKEVEILEFINTELGKTQKIEKNKRIDVIVKIDGVIANVEVNTNDYNYVKFFRNFAYLVNLFNRYSVKEIDENEKIYDLKTDIIQINLNFGKVSSKEAILINEFGNDRGMKIKNLRSYDVFIDNIKKFCYDNGGLDEYKYLLMLDMTLDELEDFYPDDEIVKEYGDALMKYSEDVFIYPHSEEEEKQMMHDMEVDMAYDKGVDAGIKEGIEQKEIEMIKNLKDKLSIEEIADVAKVSIDKVKEIISNEN
ncbi:MAG TPA: hypothetical protein IAB40_00050 [Candidatus Onthocola stercoravium]|nr:hypothetical protein [Candidatus Onthocola stercoravium]